jgi:MFS transporter, DHA1 family, multidrug resistance protein
VTEGPTARPSRVRYALLLGSLMALSPLTLDTYLPALPAIVADFGTSPAAVQLTLTGSLLGLAVGQLFVGPLSDSFGRKRPLLVGVSLHILASVLIIMAPSIEVLGALRVLQGLGGSAGTVIAMATVRDLFVGREAASLIARLMLVMGAAPMLAPALGSLLLRVADWQGVFVALAVYSLALVAVVTLGHRETLPPERRRPAGVGSVLRSFGVLLRDRVYVGLLLVGSLALAGMFSYIAGSSFVLQEQYGLSPGRFGLVFGAGALCFVIGTQTTGFLLRRFLPRQLLLGASLLGSSAGVLFLVLAGTGAGGLAGTLVPIWLVILAIGLAAPNSPALALSRHGERAGAAAALLGASQFGVGAVTSPLVGVLGNDALALALTMGGAQLLSLTVLLTVVRPWSLQTEPVPV